MNNLPEADLQQHDWTHDLVLRALQNLDDPVGGLVRAFPGRAFLSDEPDWLENWFLELAERFRDGDGPEVAEIVASASEEGELSLLAKPPVDQPLRLVSVLPIHFRGFREPVRPIFFEADLVVIEGRNSSGKTSISEAVEWAFTGQLSRRSSGEYGHATELADCIANEFRPSGAETSVELQIEIGDDAQHTLKRVLTKDYSTVAKASPKSDLYLDGTKLTAGEEEDLRENWLAGVHPILMQHTLRRFVHDDPTSRRRYFERLLQIDELTALIEKAVIGNKKIGQLQRSGGGLGLEALRSLAVEATTSLDESAPVAKLHKLESGGGTGVEADLEEALIEIAVLGADDDGEDRSLSDWRDRLMELQQVRRESRLPLLGSLEKSRSKPIHELSTTRTELPTTKAALEALLAARTALMEVTETNQQVAAAFETLVDAGLVQMDEEFPQVCPICEDPSKTLTEQRAMGLGAITPLIEALRLAKQNLDTSRDSVKRDLERLRESIVSATPPTLSKEEVRTQADDVSAAVVSAAQAAIKSAASVRKRCQEAIDAIDEALRVLAGNDLKPSMVEHLLDDVDEALTELREERSSHGTDVSNLQQAVGAASYDDEVYRLWEAWLKCEGLTEKVAEDVGWESAKRLAKSSLDDLREGLIQLRTEIIEDARRAFSEEMTDVWHLLRSDSGARFSRLSIPPARGRGFKLEFELKAIISDGTAEPEVDALRVFSESQVNVVGIAAYVTRAMKLGHRLLIFDDPVQSMDEEHFRSFAANLLPRLLAADCQVVILTHSDTFARRIHDYHYLSESYATLETRASKRKGCWLSEGNRRVSERLKNAERAAEEGDLQRAWRFVRLAIERLYPLAYDRANEDFKMETWRGLTAEDMWNRGVGEIIEDAVPGSGKRLKEIVEGTVAGAHDEPGRSETDVVDAIQYLRTLLDPLHLGAG